MAHKSSSPAFAMQAFGLMTVYGITDFYIRIDEEPENNRAFSIDRNGLIPGDVLNFIGECAYHALRENEVSATFKPGEILRVSIHPDSSFLYYYMKDFSVLAARVPFQR